MSEGRRTAWSSMRGLRMAMGDRRGGLRGGCPEMSEKVRASKKPWPGETAAQFQMQIVHGVGGAGGDGAAADGAGDVFDAEGAGDLLDQVGLAGEVLAEGGDEPGGIGLFAKAEAGEDGIDPSLGDIDAEEGGAAAGAQGDGAGRDRGAGRRFRSRARRCRRRLEG